MPTNPQKTFPQLVLQVPASQGHVAQQTKLVSWKHKRPAGGQLFHLFDHKSGQAAGWVTKSFSCKSVSCPTFLMCHCPHEEFAFTRGPALPNSLPRAKMDGPSEKCLISWFCREGNLRWRTAICVCLLLLAAAQSSQEDFRVVDTQIWHPQWEHLLGLKFTSYC